LKQKDGDMFVMRKQCLAFLLSLGITNVVSLGQAVPAEKANEARIDRLLHQLTLEEKMDLIRGGIEDAAVYQGQAGFLPGVPRLHIPSLRFADGPPGLLTRVPAQAETATMGVAATFSTKDAEANGVVIGREARSLGIDVVLQPFINIDRDITFARGYNTFGEDPMLTGAMGAAEIRGAQSQGVMAQAKHYLAYDTDSYNVFVDQQTLHEVYAEDGMTLEQLMAFAVTPDQGRQEQVWDNVSRSQLDEPHQIRRMLTENSVRASDRRAQFIGLDAYEQAGGAIMRDLFEHDDGGWLQDVPLLDRLVTEKLKVEAETIAAEGWKWIAVAVNFPIATPATSAS